MGVDVELRHLRCLVAVVDEGGFTNAARVLHLSQPALSETIRTLERRVGTELLVRNARPTRPTPAGAALIEDARSLLAAADRALERVVQVAAGRQGEVVLAGTSSLSARFMPALVGRLARELPDVVVRQRLVWTPELSDLVRDGARTVGFGRHVERSHATLSYATLGAEPVMACLGEDHRLADRDAVGLADLAQERWAVMDRAMAPRWYDAFVASCRAAGFNPDIAEAVAAADQAGADPVFARIGAGELVSYAGVSLGPALSRHGVRMVPFDASLAPLPIDAVWGPEDPVSAAIVEVGRRMCADAGWIA